MKSREWIIAMFAGLAFAGMAAAAWVGLASMQPSARAQAQREWPLPPLPEGVPYFARVGSSSLILLRPSPAQREAIARMDAHVWDSRHQAWHEAAGVFVFWDVDTRLGCTLRHVPAGQSTLALYSGYEHAEWLEGYVSRCGDTTYDLAGRAIKDKLFSYNGATYQVPNLKAPSIRRSGEHFMILLKPYEPD